MSVERSCGRQWQPDWGNQLNGAPSGQAKIQNAETGHPPQLPAGIRTMQVCGSVGRQKEGSSNLDEEGNLNPEKTLGEGRWANALWTPRVSSEESTFLSRI
jgi:hypothetical protein